MVPASARAPLLIATLALFWGSGFFWIKLALGGLSPFQLTFARLLLGALALAAIMTVRRLPFPRQRRTWLHLAVAALIANAIPYSLFAFAELTVPSALAGTINATTPLWTAVIASVAGIDRLSRPRRVVGLVVGFAGAVILLSPWNGGENGDLLGVLACLGATVSYGFAYVYLARYLTNRGVPPLMLAFAQTSIATGALALTLPIGGHEAITLSGIVVGAILVLGILGTGIAYVINYELIATEGPTAASVVTYLVPAVSVALGVAFLDEPFGFDQLGGIVLVLLGVWMARRRAVPGAERLDGSERG